MTDVVPDYLRRRAEDLHVQGEAVRRALSAAQSALDALGRFWGTDEYGHAFYDGAGGRKGYGTALPELVDHCGTVAGVFGAVGDKLAQAGANVTAAEWVSVAAMVKAVDETSMSVPTTKAERR
ncbi:hypothetical protein [Sphaerisporangium rufum]|uniref:hypothetical protein n=1 Tax=Sphaerisporangium rufum TaxID=1381558 RepID=UPI00194EB844|nr:hypothetical protein [Sphaerisporangium rufum]